MARAKTKRAPDAAHRVVFVRRAKRRFFMKRMISVLVSILAFGMGAVPAAFGAPPIHQRSGWRELDLEFADACAFPVDVHLHFRGQLTIFVDADGDPVRAIATGPVLNTVTNEDTGASITFSASGPVFLDADLKVVRATGANVFIGDGLLFVAGRIEFGPNGEIESIRGHTTDLCERLG
jgi:hypothetical protein